MMRGCMTLHSQGSMLGPYFRSSWSEADVLLGALNQFEPFEPGA